MRLTMFHYITRPVNFTWHHFNHRWARVGLPTDWTSSSLLNSEWMNQEEKVSPSENPKRFHKLNLFSWFTCNLKSFRFIHSPRRRPSSEIGQMNLLSTYIALRNIVHYSRTNLILNEPWNNWEPSCMRAGHNVRVGGNMTAIEESVIWKEI